MEKKSLVVLWTSGDKDVAHKMVFMYTKNSKVKGWWEHVTLIIWGPSARLAAEDAEIRKGLTDMAEQGVVLEACKACSDMYGVSEKLLELGIDVKYMGQPFTAYLKGDHAVITV